MFACTLVVLHIALLHVSHRSLAVHGAVRLQSDQQAPHCQDCKDSETSKNGSHVPCLPSVCEMGVFHGNQLSQAEPCEVRACVLVRLALDGVFVAYGHRDGDSCESQRGGFLGYCI